MTPATYDFDEVRRGDTFEACPAFLTLLEDGEPVSIASARMQVRTDDEKAKLVLEWSTEDDSITITGDDSNVLNLGAKTAVVMAACLAGDHLYDLELTTSGGVVMTPLKGVLPISADITR